MQIVTNLIIWLAPRAGKIKRILCSDWLPERQNGPILPTGDFPLCSLKTEFFGVIFWLYNKSFIDQGCSVKMAGYWPRVFFLRFMDRDELTLRLVNNAFIAHIEISRFKVEIIS